PGNPDRFAIPPELTRRYEMRWQSRTSYLDSIHTAWLCYDLGFRHKYSGAPMERENLPEPEPVNPPEPAPGASAKKSRSRNTGRPFIKLQG
ncbi:MAG: hypothetical protein RKO24_07635, partial [Candidatus Competibacter sp.]|nr:hypothetical protein [Candidatus Competibacter sp.]